MRKLLIAISFFTRFPITLKDVREEEFYDSMILMPVVGILIGAILAAVAWLTGYIHVKSIQALCVMIAYLWISGGLHLDGFGDTIDGIFSSRDHDRMMEIMKDSRLGSFGAIALILLFLTTWSSLTEILPDYPVAILLMPILGRYCAIQACCFTTYARGGGGLGKRVVEMTRPWHVLIYCIMVLGIAYLVLQLAGIIVAVLTMLTGILLMFYIKHRVGGMTGDTIGMTIEFTQAAYLVILTVVLALYPSVMG